MKPHFEDSTFKFDLDAGGTVDVDMAGDYLAAYHNTYDLEIDFYCKKTPYMNKDLETIHFVIDGVAHSGRNLVDWCYKNIDAYTDEAGQEAACEIKHIRVYSSPKLSGRV